LICSNLLSRGINLKSISCVINYEVAPTFDDHIHWVGRAGWGVEEGISYTLLLRKEKLEAEWLLRHLEK